MTEAYTAPRSTALLLSWRFVMTLRLPTTTDVIGLKAKAVAEGFEVLRHRIVRIRLVKVFSCTTIEEAEAHNEALGEEVWSWAPDFGITTGEYTTEHVPTVRFSIRGEPKPELPDGMEWVDFG